MRTYKKNKFLQFLFIVLFMLGILLVYFGFNNVKLVLFNYNENSDIKYKVYLKPNQFFETEYLDENETYIASLIDYIDVTFDYNARFSNNLDGDIKYKYIAIVSANKKDADGHYWQRSYDLTENKTVRLDNSSVLSINDNFKIKYDNYNSLLNKFKKEYNLNTDGELKVLMQINNDSVINGTKTPINIESKTSLAIPLLEKALEMSINKDTANNNKTLKFKENDNSAKYIVFKVLGIALIVGSIFGFVRVSLKRKSFKEENEYELTLKKILENYDSIIADVKNVPSLDEDKKINLNSFEELLDVYNEVRMPINYYQNEKEDKSTFIIINNNVAWIYVLKKDN